MIRKIGTDKSNAGIEYKSGSFKSVPILASIKLKKNGKKIKIANPQIKPITVLFLNDLYTQASLHLTMYLS